MAQSKYIEIVDLPIDSMVIHPFLGGIPVAPNRGLQPPQVGAGHTPTLWNCQYLNYAQMTTWQSNICKCEFQFWPTTKDPCKNPN